jgi:hypothetical protein
MSHGAEGTDEGSEQDDTSSAGGESMSSSGTDATSSEGSSSEVDGPDESESSKQETLGADKMSLPEVAETPKTGRLRAISSTSAAPGLSITIPANQPEKDEKKVHPLEALFKRPTTKDVISSTGPSNLESSFTFFEPNFESGVPMPQTPFTQRDFHERGQRSAAPTPDTAAPGRKFSFAWRRGESGDTDDEEDEEAATSHPSGLVKDSSVLASPAPQEDENHKNKTFEETFWEKRGEFNRAWKKRRRETGKERKKRENKRVGRRVA